jgi:D-galactose 1-dehydrogenase
LTAHRIGIIGLGKIAHDQHLPVIAKNPDFELAAIVSRRGLTVDGVPTFSTAEHMYAALPDLDAVALCTPPGAHFEGARDALSAGKHVLLEKPPTLTLSELAALQAMAASGGLSLFTTWHSRFNAGVFKAREILADRGVTSLAITWKEDVRRWHPGQKWIWEAGGFGVFDPGINALSILTFIMPGQIGVRSAELEVPANCQTPIAARVVFSYGDAGGPFTADIDWRQTGPQTWDIDLTTADGGQVLLQQGGTRLVVDGVVVVEEEPDEYEQIYVRFAELLASGGSEVDAAPLVLVADAFMSGRRNPTEAFFDEG